MTAPLTRDEAERRIVEINEILTGPSSDWLSDWMRDDLRDERRALRAILTQQEQNNA